MKRVSFGLGFLLVALAVVNAEAQERIVDIQQLTQDLQRLERSGADFKLIWWVPTEFWQESFRNLAMTEKQKDAFLKALDDYIVFIIVDGVFTPLGTLQASPVDVIHEKMSIVIGGGEAVRPLAPAELSDEAQMLLAK